MTLTVAHTPPRAPHLEVNRRSALKNPTLIHHLPDLAHILGCGVTAAAICVTLSLSFPQATQASIPLGPAATEERRQAPRQTARTQFPVRPVKTNNKPRETVRQEIDAVMALMAEGSAAAENEEWDAALSSYSKIIDRYSDLALAERARITRALLMYQVGRVEEALLQLEDEEVALRGSAEVHAALASILHAERPTQVGRAEQQWAIAASFDSRYEDPEWVRTQRKWPPRMIAVLQRFLSLT